VSFSPYLSEAYSFANVAGTPLIMALDLDDAIPVDGIKAQLQNSKKFLDEHKLNIDQVAKVLSGIRGITLGVTFREKPFGKIKVDFTDDLKLPPDVAKAALIHALGNHGAMIDEFEDWKPAVTGKQITLEGYLEASGMRRIASLFDRPPSLKPRESSPAQAAKTTQQIMQEASQAYFKRVTGLIDDIKGEKKGNSGYTIATIGVWMDKYAKKIDQLSVLHVDPELVEYGAGVSDSLRAAYGAIRGGAARSRVRQVNTPMQYDYYSGGATYGYSYRAGWMGSYAEVAVPNQMAYNHERTRVRTEERIASSSSARDIMANVQEATGQIRRKMTQKYSADF
jgi:hypothetical protein